MKRLLTLILPLALCIPMAVSAQKEKVVESSDKRKPEWIGRPGAEYLCVTEQGVSLAEASERALASIRQQILNAVAVNVSSTETMVARQISRDNLTTVLNDYTSRLMTEAAKLPYLNDIALPNATDIYWERIYDKKQKSYRYEYSVQYPFTEQTRRQLVEAFLAIDNARVAEYERLCDELESIENIDRIRQAVNELEGLHDYFFDATRRRQTETLRRNYLDLYKRISIRIEAEILGHCLYSLRLDGRRVTTGVEPRLLSETAVEMSVKAYGDDCYLLSYNPEYASRIDENRIEILYLFGGTRISKTLYFDPAPQAPLLQPCGTILLESPGDRLHGTMQFRVNGAQAEIASITLWSPTDGSEIQARALTPTLLQKGERSLRFDAEAALPGPSRGLDILRGRVTYRNPESGENIEKDFILPFKLTVKQPKP